MASRDTNKLTPKQKLFIKNKVENPGISDRKAAMLAGYSKNTAINAGRDILAKPAVEKFIEGLASDETLQDKLNEGLESYRVDITGDKQPDFKTRLAYVQEMLGLKGYKRPVNEDNPNVKRRIVAEEFFE